MQNNKSDNILKTAVIMAGGEGTRLREITGPLPKAMVNIKGTQSKYYGQAKDTILEHQIDVLSENGVTNFIFVVGNKKEFIKTSFTNEIINRNVYTKTPNDRNIHIHFFEEESPLGTGGSFCYKQLQQLIGNQDFLFTYSDVLFDVNVQSMFNFHKRNNANATVLVAPSKTPDDRPLCVFEDNSSEIISMIPKQGKQDGPRKGLFPNTPKNGLIILNSSFFKLLPETPTFLDFEENILIRMIYDDSFKVCGWQTPCYLKDIGVVSRYYEGVKDLSNGIPELRNPNKNPQSCCVFRESDVLDLSTEGIITLNPEIPPILSTLNSQGTITVLEKDLSAKLNNPQEDLLIDTLLVRQSSPCYLNAKIDDLTQIKPLLEEWNISLENLSYLEKQDGTWMSSTITQSQQQSNDSICNSQPNLDDESLNQ